MTEYGDTASAALVVTGAAQAIAEVSVFGRIPSCVTTRRSARSAAMNGPRRVSGLPRAAAARYSGLMSINAAAAIVPKLRQNRSSDQ